MHQTNFLLLPPPLVRFLNNSPHILPLSSNGVANHIDTGLNEADHDHERLDRLNQLINSTVSTLCHHTPKGLLSTSDFVRLFPCALQAFFSINIPCHQERKRIAVRSLLLIRKDSREMDTVRSEQMGRMFSGLVDGGEARRQGHHQNATHHCEDWINDIVPGNLADICRDLGGIKWGARQQKNPL